MHDDCDKQSRQVRCRSRIACAAIIVLLVAACTRAPLWSDADRESAQHYVRSLEANDKAALIMRRGDPDTPQFGVQEINKYQRTALHEAQLVSDSVLDKVHPELRAHFRSEYQKGLELILESYEAAASTSSPPLKTQIERQASGVALLSQWKAWLEAHRSEIKIDAALVATR